MWLRPLLKQEVTAVKIKIAQKDTIGYLLLLILAASCIAVGIIVLQRHHIVSGTFSLVLGVALVAASSSMVLRRE